MHGKNEVIGKGMINASCPLPPLSLLSFISPSVSLFFSKHLFNFLPALSFQPYEGLKLQDLRRLKDMLIVETADMLQAPLFTAEALLRAHGVCLSVTQSLMFVRLPKHPLQFW